MRLTTGIIAFCVFAFTMCGASADIITNVGGWTIGIDRAVHGCYMSMTYDNGATFRVGIDRTNDRAFIWLQHRVFQDLSEGDSYKMEIAFDNGSRWTGNAQAIRADDGSLLLEIPFDKTELLADLMHRDVIAFYYRGELLTSLQLVGSHVAIDAMLECQRQYG